MGAKLYVGNLTFGTTDSMLNEMFTPYGTVRSAQVVNERDTGQSSGFGFVEMQSDGEATAAIAGLNGNMVGGRSLTVSEVLPKVDRGGNGRNIDNWRVGRIGFGPHACSRVF